MFCHVTFFITWGSPQSIIVPRTAILLRWDWPNGSRSAMLKRGASNRTVTRSLWCRIHYVVKVALHYLLLHRFEIHSAVPSKGCSLATSRLNFVVNDYLHYFTNIYNVTTVNSLLDKLLGSLDIWAWYLPFFSAVLLLSVKPTSLLDGHSCRFNSSGARLGGIDLLSWFFP